MQALRMHPRGGQTFNRGPEFDPRKLSATVLHERQFKDIPEAKPAEKPDVVHRS